MNNIIEKYKNAKEITSRFLLDDGGIVIGTEIDNRNHLLYVIDRKGELSVEHAVGNIPVKNLIPPRESRVIIVKQLTLKAERLKLKEIDDQTP